MRKVRQLFIKFETNYINILSQVYMSVLQLLNSSDQRSDHFIIILTSNYWFEKENLYERYLNYGLFVQIGWSTQTINENQIVLVSPNKMFNFYYIDIAIYVTRMHSAALLPERDRVNYYDNDTLHPCYTQSFSYDYYLEHSINFCNAYSVSRLRLSVF